MDAECEAMTLERSMEFLDRVNRGLISGRISEWPGLREACGVAFAHLTYGTLSRAAEPVAWAHDTKGYAYVISDAVRQLWLKAKPKHVKHYTVPLFTHQPEPARDAKVSELVAAACAYFGRYCVDEADDWFDEGERVGESTGVTREQHAAANRLRDAITAMAKESGDG